MVSLPIPENVRYPEVNVTFNKLGDSDDQERGVSSIINRFSSAFDTSRKVHLDPDIRPALRRVNCADPLGYFGQESGSMTQLKNHGVCDAANGSLSFSTAGSRESGPSAAVDSSQKNAPSKTSELMIST